VGPIATAEKPRPEYHLPPLALLDNIAPRIGDSGMDHERNAAIIAAKLASFGIPARVVAWNAGPVVTQYEVEPSPEIKVSRIEALSDDLAMALAARRSASRRRSRARASSASRSRTRTSTSSRCAGSSRRWTSAPPPS
jgi:DNA segregation ATPase FtsK/SpoIIIE-like protein